MLHKFPCDWYTEQFQCSQKVPFFGYLTPWVCPFFSPTASHSALDTLEFSVLFIVDSKWCTWNMKTAVKYTGLLCENFLQWGMADALLVGPGIKGRQGGYTTSSMAQTCTALTCLCCDTKSSALLVTFTLHHTSTSSPPLIASMCHYCGLLQRSPHANTCTCTDGGMGGHGHSLCAQVCMGVPWPDHVHSTWQGDCSLSILAFLDVCINLLFEMRLWGSFNLMLIFCQGTTEGANVFEKCMIYAAWCIVP